jgi:glutathione S-transferase
MITVYGRATSSNVQAVMWGIGELGLPHQRLDYGHVHGGTDTPEYRAMNPNGLVPTIRDGDLVLFESCAILRYLGGRYGHAPFWPEDPVARAPIDVWAEWGKTTLIRAFNVPIFWAVVRTPPSQRDPRALACALRTFDGQLEIIEKRLGRRPYVTGPDFTLADIVIGHTLFRYFTVEIPRRAWPGLEAYYARLTERPAFREHVMVSYEPLRAVEA